MAKPAVRDGGSSPRLGDGRATPHLLAKFVRDEHLAQNGAAVASKVTAVTVNALSAAGVEGSMVLEESLFVPGGTFLRVVSRHTPGISAVDAYLQARDFFHEMLRRLDLDLAVA